MKICKQCNRELPENSDYYFSKKGNFVPKCKECMGHKFTNKLSHIPREGYCFCKKCDRELPYTFQYFPEDRSTNTGLRYVCRECNPYYGRFLRDDETPHRAWSEEEDKLMYEYYSHYTGEELKEIFFPNRSIRALEARANTLGITGKDIDAQKRAHQHQGLIVSEKLKGRIFSEESKLKMSESTREYYATHQSYWLGKKRSIEQCEIISQRQKGKWAGDKNPRHKFPLNGSLNGRWKGGATNIYFELRSDTKDWQKQSMEFCQYKCIITGESFNDIHHTTSFKNIVDQVFELLNISVRSKVEEYDLDELNAMRETLKYLHNLYGLGACLNYNVHKLFHDNYGYINFTPFDFLDFIYRIDSGEFNSWFLENNFEIRINYYYVKYLESTLLSLKSA